MPEQQAASGQEAPRIHLVVLQHGLWGSPDNVGRLHDWLAQHLPGARGSSGGADPAAPAEQWRLLNSDVNAGRATYDGVDVCGVRLAGLVQEAVAALAGQGARVTKLSLIGYSLGGLIARYAAGKLYVAGLFDSVEPVNFITIATPHLGSFKDPTSVWARFFNSQVPIIASRTGAQLMLSDADYTVPWLDQQQALHEAGRARARGGRGGRPPAAPPAAPDGDGVPPMPGVAPGGPVPLLLLMAHPRGPFHHALGAFRMRIAAANIRHDTTVPYCTAALRTANPYDDAPPAPLAPCGRFPSVVRPATRAEAAARGGAFPAAAGGRLRLYILMACLPLLPLWLVYLHVNGLAHRRRAARRTLDVAWLHAFAARQQAEQAQAAVAAGAGEGAAAAGAGAAADGGSPPRARPTLAAGGAGGAPGARSVTRRRGAAAASFSTSASWSDEEAEAEARDAAELAHAGHALLSGDEARALGSSAAAVREHEGMVERPLVLHAQQAWMVEQLVERLPPCWVRDVGAAGAGGAGGAAAPPPADDDASSQDSQGSCSRGSSGAGDGAVTVVGSASGATGGAVAAAGKGGGWSEGGWHRVDVWTGHLHAHAAIAVRDARYETQSRDHFQYIAAVMAL
ncbi:LPL1 [Scenedesmus sp. PABB004]|nr:LPL1 [Scenedesmus sp. PABB004]